MGVARNLVAVGTHGEPKFEAESQEWGGVLGRAQWDIRQSPENII